MRARHAEVNVIHCTSVVDAYAKAGRWQAALRLLSDDMPAMRVAANEVSYNAAISSCERGGQWQLALSLLGRMPSEHLRPDLKGFSAAISACEKAGRWQLALGLLGSMSCVRVLPDVITCSAAISACAKDGRWQVALCLFDCMPAAGLAPNEVTCNALLTACEKGSQWQLALGLLGSMPEARLRPDRISCSAAISACEKGGRWQLALGLLESMPAHGTSPDEICFAAVIGACERDGRWQQALGVVDAMRLHRLEPNGIMWGGLLGSMARDGLASGVPALLEELRARWWSGSGHSPDPAAGRAELGAAAAALSAALAAGGGGGGGGGGHFPVAVQTPPRVLLQAPGVVALHKPPGMTSEELRAGVAAALEASGCAGDVTAVSRLDVHTSGVMPLALGRRDSGAAFWLQAQFAARRVSKEYLCLCAGRPLGPVGSAHEVDAPLLVVEDEGSRTSVWSPAGKEARTRFRVLEVFPRPDGGEGALSLLRARPLTGRTHQIRAHLAGAGRPLVGDKAYGGPSCGCPRYFLHCRRLSLLDLAGARFEPEAPLPADLAEVLSRLRR